MSISSETMMFKRTEDKKDVAQTIREVYAALEEKGYRPACGLSFKRRPHLHYQP